MKTAARLLFLASCLVATLRSAEAPAVFVDQNGVMRWTKSQEEVALFGVNYTTPFAHAFRAHQQLGIPIEKAIDADVYHFARLGFDAYRVHVWDREVSDANGNLLVNEHVRAFDYLLAKLKERGIKIILTPLQFGNAAYPESGSSTGGFSSKYGKEGCLENRESWPLQERYLAQFVAHVNPLTGLAYRDDPDILAFEICNEPGHFEYALTLEYINRMTQAIRGTGCAKPLFYNMSHGLPVVQAYLDANVQGGTFQWYPSNLVAGHEQRGNFLPYVDHYPIPFAANEKFQHKARIAYEFDTADIGRSYLYPAMARSFRTDGFQFATQFAYDPMYLAPCNTEYQTHYLNLAYAPQKALSMMVAGEAFRRVPRFHDYGEYPGNTQFAGVHLSYEDDLAELVTEEKFFYTNRTSTRPPAPERLTHIAGYASSPVVDYPGRGAYFLDRLDPGVWRLEVMPDAIWVRDPFEKASPRKQVSRIAWNEWPMRIQLPDLGAAFTAIGLNDGNTLHVRTTAGVLPVRPGSYLLTRDGVTTRWRRDDKWGNIVLKEFVAPAASIDQTYVLHHPPAQASAGENYHVNATVVAPTSVEQVELIAYPPWSSTAVDEPVNPPARAQPGKGNGPGAVLQDNGGALTFPMTKISGFEYSAEIPGRLLQAGTLRYHIAVRDGSGWTSFPSGLAGLPTDWDFYGRPWSIPVVSADAPVLLFDAQADVNFITADHRDVHYELVPSDRPGLSAMAVMAKNLAQGEHDLSFRFFFKDKIAGRISRAAAAKRLVLYGRSATSEPCRLQLALVTADGVAYGGMVTVQAQSGAWSVPVEALKQVRSPDIPHGYPVFIPFWSALNAKIPLDMNRVESVLVSIGPGLEKADWPKDHGVQIERIWLE